MSCLDEDRLEQVGTDGAGGGVGHPLALVPEAKWGLLDRIPPGEGFKGRAALRDSRVWVGGPLSGRRCPRGGWVPA